MTPIHLAWVPFSLAIGLLIVSTVTAVIIQLLRYPFLGRFSFLYDRDPDTHKRLNLRVVIVGWGSLLLGFGFSAWSLFRFTQLLNEMFLNLDRITIAGKLLAVALPFIYVLIPYHLTRFSTAMVYLAAPQDYAALRGLGEQTFSWGYAAQLEPDKVDPGQVGFWQAVDTAMTLLILFFAPSAFKWVLGAVAPPQQLWALTAVGGLVLLGSFGLSLRSDRAAWTAGHIGDLLLLMGKLGVLLILFVLVSTQIEVDLVEVALFMVLAGWIGVGALWGSR